MKTKTFLSALVFLFFGILTLTAHNPTFYEAEIEVEEWMTKPFFDREIENVLLTGTTIEHGDYVVVETDEIYYFMGKEYEVYSVKYDDPAANIKIGVNGKDYIAYNEEAILFYECSRKGFGVRRILFNTPTARSKYNEREYSKQIVLCSDKRVDELTAIGLIASYVPKITELNTIAGEWHGKFMDEFKTVVIFERGDSGYTGNIKMYADENEIQNDPLYVIKIVDDVLSFYIQAKETHFKGTLSEKMTKVSGEFIFPDKSEHPINLNKIK